LDDFFELYHSEVFQNLKCFNEPFMRLNVSFKFIDFPSFDLVISHGFILNMAGFFFCLLIKLKFSFNCS